MGQKFILKVVGTVKDGRFGVLMLDTDDGVHPFAVTLEKTYDEGPTTKIPEGVYTCTRSFYHKGGYWTFDIPVEGHSRILFHRGNTEDDLDGCIAIGEMFAMFGKKQGIGQSAAGFEEFMMLCGDNKTIQLEVING